MAIFKIGKYIIRISNCDCCPVVNAFLGMFLEKEWNMEDVSSCFTFVSVIVSAVDYFSNLDE